MDLALLQAAQKEAQGQVFTLQGSSRAQGRDEVSGTMSGDWTPSAGDGGLPAPRTQGLSQAHFHQHPGAVLEAGRGQGFLGDLWAAWTRGETLPPRGTGPQEFPHRGSKSGGSYWMADTIFQWLALLFRLDRALQHASNLAV